VTGGYFADPGMKEVPGLDEVGFPIAEISGDGTLVCRPADRLLVSHDRSLDKPSPDSA
jgi:hypothetical protein